MAGSALITGAYGQDGAYLAEHLSQLGYTVLGCDRPERDRTPLARDPGVELIELDLLDPEAVRVAIATHQPHAVYHLASASFVPESWDGPVAAARFTPATTTALLEAIRLVSPNTRFWYAASAEIFGHPERAPQDESTPIAPLTPYGASKAHGLFLVRSYRARYGLHASCGILYNHESPRRPVRFLPRKVSEGVARIKVGLADSLQLGNLSATRDWSYAGDVVRAMHLMVCADEPADYVIASGVGHTVEQLVDAAFSHAGLDWRNHVEVDDTLLRPGADDAVLIGDSSRVREALGWEPDADFDGLVAMLVDHDLAELEATGAQPAC